MKNMNKPTRITLIVALCLFGVGLLVCLGAYIGSGFNLSKMSLQLDGADFENGSGYEVTEKSFDNSGKDIELELNCASVSVVPSEDDEIHFTYTNGPSSSFELDDKGDSIVLTQRNPKVFGLVLDRSMVELKLPEDYKGDVEVDTTSGSVELEGIELLSDGEISSNAGSIRLSGCSFQSLSASATSGHVSAEEVEAKEEIELNATSGGISLAGSVSKELQCKTISGSIDMEETKADTLKASASTGSIRLEAADSKALSLSTTAGRISGTLAGSAEDYTVSSRTTSGRNGLADHRGSGSRTLEATTTAGSISIEFDA